jgi:hypothetical protein
LGRVGKSWEIEDTTKQNAKAMVEGKNREDDGRDLMRSPTADIGCRL